MGIYNLTPPTLADGQQTATRVNAAGELIIASGGTPLAVSSTPSSAATATLTQVASNVAAVTILAANTLRKGATVYYDGGAILYLLEGAGTPSATNYTVKMGAGFITLYEPMGSYTGALKGIWSAAVGSANVTERTA